MSSSVKTFILRGRPFGEVAIMVNKRLQPYTQMICTGERYAVVKVSNHLFINWYMPCSGTPDKQFIIDEVLRKVGMCIQNHIECNLVLGGDFNCDLDSSDFLTRLILDFMKENNVFRCNLAAGCNKIFTYCGDALGNYSCIDFVLMSDLTYLCTYTVK